MMVDDRRDDNCSCRALQVWEDIKVTPQNMEEDNLKMAGDLSERGGLSSARRRRVTTLVDQGLFQWLLELCVARGLHKDLLTRKGGSLRRQSPAAAGRKDRGGAVVTHWRETSR
jgi:hypothetical protein